MIKERDTTIMPVRIKLTLLAKVKEKVERKKVSRNSWLIWCIRQGLRNHKKKGV